MTHIIMAATSAFLLHLPVDILLFILDEIDNSPRTSSELFDVADIRVKTFLSLCSTCRALNDIATRYLYKTVGVTVANHEPELEHTSPMSSPEALRKLLQTVNERPDRASAAKCLALRLGMRDLFYPCQPAEPETDLQASRNDLYENLCALFAHLPNVIEVDFRSDSRYTSFWREIVGPSETRFSRKFLLSLRTFRTSPQESNFAAEYSKEIGIFVPPLDDEGVPVPLSSGRRHLVDVADFQQILCCPSYSTCPLPWSVP